MNLTIELDATHGLRISGRIAPPVLKALLTIILGLGTLPWLETLARAFGFIA